jgi:hypothetical protein
MNFPCNVVDREGRTDKPADTVWKPVSVMVLSCNPSLLQRLFGVQQNKTLLMSGLVGDEDSDDSIDSEEDDSDDPASRQQSPPANGGASNSAARPARDSKRERPEDMQEAFVVVKRANVPLASLLTTADRSNAPSGRATPTATDGAANGAADGVHPLQYALRVALQKGGGHAGVPETQMRYPWCSPHVPQRFCEIGSRLCLFIACFVS